MYRIWMHSSTLCTASHRKKSPSLVHLTDDICPEMLSGVRLCSDNKQSLEVPYMHLAQQHPKVALYVADSPAHILPILNRVRSRSLRRYTANMGR